MRPTDVAAQQGLVDGSSLRLQEAGRELNPNAGLEILIQELETRLGDAPGNRRSKPSPLARIGAGVQPLSDRFDVV